VDTHYEPTTDLFEALTPTESTLLPPELTWRDRIANYERVTGFPNALFIAGDGRVVGTLIMGNDYRVKSQYYGGYPATYLCRIKALFPDKKRVLHLFSGRVDLDTFPGDTVDITQQSVI
jgi:hypothetical protein